MTNFAQIRGLLERATPGPWQVSGARSRADIKLGRNASTFGIGPDGDAVAVVFHEDSTGRGHIDGKLIVAAVNALPSLLSRIKTLEKALSRISDWGDCALQHPSCALDMRTTARVALGTDHD